VPFIVKSREGKVLLEAEGPNFLDGQDLRRADFSGQQLEGIDFSHCDLREADLSCTNLYWASAFRANFGGAILRNAQLNGANLVEAGFCNADLRGAYISYDNLGGPPNLKGADFTGALLEETVLEGCEYDDSTIFPSGFDPAAHGMTWVDPERFYVRPGSYAANLEPGFYVPNKENPGFPIPWKKN
jgi:uncharacterized protein YjbI with pentapeptide repeats